MKYLRLREVLADVQETETISFDRMMFNGGESHIKLLSSIPKEVTIETQLKNSGYVMELFIATDALRRAGAEEITLLSPYIPYSRQDRMMVPGEPLSLKVFTNIVNTQNYAAVYTLDNHSPVATALIDRCAEIDNSRIIQEAIEYCGYDDALFISPDAGADKKVQSLAKRFSRDVVHASKIRRVDTGEVTEIRVHCDDLADRDCLIVDDICDGGRTFVGLAKALKWKNAGRIALYVSHGIFYWGTPALQEHIGNILTTNCFREDAQVLDNITIIPITKEDLK